MNKFACLCVILLILFFDRFFKLYVIHHFLEGGGFAVIPGVFHITRVSNTGAAFGILRHSGWWLALVSGVSIFFLVIGFLRHRSSLYWALVIAGALGNLYDRLRYGFVIDYLDFRIWPVFNLADMSICAGAFFILLDFLRNREIF